MNLPINGSFFENIIDRGHLREGGEGKKGGEEKGNYYVDISDSEGEDERGSGGKDGGRTGEVGSFTNVSPHCFSEF